MVGPHLSLADGGVSFGSTAAGGVCLRFGVPVPGLAPGGWPRHPAATVTVTHRAALLPFPAGADPPGLSVPVPGSAGGAGSTAYRRDRSYEGGTGDG